MLISSRRYHPSELIRYLRECYPPRLSVWLLPLVLTYALTSQYVVRIFSEANNVSLVWPLSGVALALVLLGGRRLLPVIGLSEVIGNLLTDLTPPLSIALALSVVIETASCQWLLNKCDRFDDRLQRTQDFIDLAMAAAVGAAIGSISATASFLCLGHPGMPLFSTFLHWWQGDVLGIILITPLILVWRDWPRHWLRENRVVSMLALFTGAFLVGQFAYLGWMETLFAAHARAYWSLLFVTAAAVGFGRHGVLLIIVLTAAQALLGYIRNAGAFGGNSLQDVWFFLVILTVVGIALAINVEERIRREAELSVSQRTLKSLLQRNEQVREEERRHIAHEIHDELGQVLTAIKMDAALLARADTNRELWQTELKHLMQLIDGCIKVVRNITQHLRPPVLALGLGPALQWLVDQFTGSYGIDCRLTISGDADSIQDPYLTAVFRMVQEALTNIARHAQAFNVAINLALTPERLSLVVIDDGHGFDVDTELKVLRGNGLSGMLHRVQMLDGEFEIRSDGGGTILQCHLPLHNTGESL